MTRQLMLATLCAAALLACRAADRQVGSACAGGVCPNAAAVQSGLVCQYSSVLATIPLVDGVPQAGLCGIPIPTDADGMLPCRLLWGSGRLLEDAGVSELASCDPLFLGQADDLPDVCLVHQLTPAERTAGTERGWSWSNVNGCGRFQFTQGVTLPAGRLQLQCKSALARGEDGVVGQVDPDVCAGVQSLADDEHVGAACVPQLIPEEGFRKRQPALEAPSPDCTMGACLVFGRSDCFEASCSRAELVENDAYCTCRCDAGGGPGPECSCPDGFACRELLSSGPADLIGGYCVRND